jgi:hypothetical protein
MMEILLTSTIGWIAYTASPWLIVTWCYGPATNSVLESIGFRWGFGIWAIVYPIVCAPLFWLMWHNLKKAEKQGLIPKQDSGRTWRESVIYYAVQFDVVGILLIATGLSLFLLSFSLYSYQAEQWKSPMIICFLVFGILLSASFSVWEAKFAPVTFVPWHLMKDRTVIFTFAMVAAIYSGYNVWYDYFYSMLIVVFNTSVRDATYILNIYTIGATFWCLVVGIIIRYNGRLKWIALYFGVPVNLLGVGLMIKFRHPDTSIGWIVMCQIFVAFGKQNDKQARRVLETFANFLILRWRHPCKLSRRYKYRVITTTTSCIFADTTLLGYLRANDRHGRLDSTKHSRHPRL